MNTTHDKFNERSTAWFGENRPTAADCTRALDEANRSLDNAERTETELEIYRLITKLREAERKIGRLKGTEKACASIMADNASAKLILAIRKAVQR